MVKENEERFSDLISLRKIGFGKVSYVDSSFIIDKDYKARYEIRIDREFNDNVESTERVELSDEEKHLVDIFISRFVEPKVDCRPLFSDTTDRYEREEIQYGKIIIQDDETLNKGLRSIADYIESEHEEISANVIAGMYDSMCDEIYGTRCSK